MWASLHHVWDLSQAGSLWAALIKMMKSEDLPFAAMRMPVSWARDAGERGKVLVNSNGFTNNP